MVREQCPPHTELPRFVNSCPKLCVNLRDDLQNSLAVAACGSNSCVLVTQQVRARSSPPVATNRRPRASSGSRLPEALYTENRGWQGTILYKCVWFMIVKRQRMPVDKKRIFLEFDRWMGLIQIGTTAEDIHATH